MESFPEERKRYIIDRLKYTQKITVSEVSEQFNVSMETVRRDLDVLEAEGLVKRVYGGAVSGTYHHGEPPLLKRKKIMEDQKKRIGEKAATLIQDGSTIVIDVGTTVLGLAKEIKYKKDITIFTNSLPVADLLLTSMDQGYFSGDVILLGGQLNPKQHSISGKLSEMVLEQFNIDQAFISVGGISLQNGLSDYDFNESMISKKMISVSKEIIVLADSSKLGVDAFCKFGSLEDMNAIVCDSPQPDSWQGNHLVKNIDWILAE
ncbi:DeoR/GlpR family DNA-binding transcription regulator [Oceanobacillus salinisoli]|uniref:DeoR/GlpR family DNA-binding transcription regulator n=1 Tax=Oceanobacillus salinisoli TaxID=2678611 RepID=UPI0012E13776|nr:DeoR/GlpR family DNA-binding transcription regulator [Oceanobacillus salinisoli]